MYNNNNKLLSSTLSCWTFKFNRDLIAFSNHKEIEPQMDTQTNHTQNICVSTCGSISLWFEKAMRSRSTLYASVWFAFGGLGLCLEGSEYYCILLYFWIK